MKRFLFFILMCVVAQVVWGQYKLPFAGGISVKCTAGNNDGALGGHHTGVAEYAFDLKPTNSTGSDILVACRAGQVTAIRQNMSSTSCYSNGCTSLCASSANYVVIEHSDGTRISYLHIPYNGALVQVGQTVNQGTPIAYMGTSGCSTGSHVHVQLMNTGQSYQYYQQSIPLSFDDVLVNGGIPIGGGSGYISQNYIAVPPNQSTGIYCGSVSTPRNFELFFTKSDINNETPDIATNLKVGGQSINSTTPITAMPNWSNNVYAFNALPNSNAFSSLSNNTAYNIEFDVLTSAGNTYHFFGSGQAYLKAKTSLNSSLGSGNDWLKPYVEKGLSWGLFKGSGGVSSTNFSASSDLTRGQAAAVIVSAAIYAHTPNRLMNVSNPNNDFSIDVAQGSSYYNAIHTLKNWGIITPSSSFSPNTAISIKEFVRWLDLALKFDNNDVAPASVTSGFQSRVSLNVSGTGYQTSMGRLFSIIHQVEDNNYQYEPILTAADFSLLQGNSAFNGTVTVDGTATVTRGKMAKILTNAFTAAYRKYNNNNYPYKTTPNGNNGGVYNIMSVSDVVIIGDKFENADNPLSSTPSNMGTFNFTCTSGGSLPIGYTSDYDASGNPQHFYWSMEKNGANLVSSTATHRTVTFNAPTVTTTTTWNLYSYVANNKGKAFENLITITVNPASPPTPTAPTLQATNISFSNISTTSLDVSWNRGNGAYCILTCTDANYNSNDPVNGIVYNANSNYTLAPLTDPADDSRVVYAGSGNSATITGLQAGGSYTFEVYEYNVATGNYAMYNYNSVPNNTASLGNIAPTVADFSFPNPVVETQVATFTSMSSNANTYLWSVSAGGAIQNGNTSSTCNIIFSNTGSYTVSLIASNSVTGQSSTEIKTINVISVTAILPDLSPQNITLAPATVIAGQNITVSCYVNNNSPMQGNQSSNIQYWISSDNVLDENTDDVFGQETYSVNAGQSVLITHTITVPNSYVSGTYYVFVKTDQWFGASNGLVAESNETNNVGSIALTVQTALPDLIVQSVSLSNTTLASGQSQAISFVFSNIGIGDCGTGGNWATAKAYLSTNNLFDPNVDVQCGSYSPSSLYAGTNIPVSGTIGTNSVFPVGSYYLFIAIDYIGTNYDNYNETNENNNVYTFPIQITISNPNQPTIETSNVQIVNITSNSLRVQWTNGNGSARVVVASNANCLPNLVVDGINYTANANFTLAGIVGTAGTNFGNPTTKVVYDGTGTYVDVIGLDSDGTYTFKVYEYNTVSGQKDYLQASNSKGIAAHTVISGTSWTKYSGTSLISQYPGTGNDDVAGVYFSNANNGLLLREFSSVLIANTTDGGQTWKYISEVDAPSPAYFFIGNTGWIGSYDYYSGGKIYKTTNGGTSWVNQNNPSGRGISDIMFYNVTNGYLACNNAQNATSYDGAILKTTNGGTTWNEIAVFSRPASSVFFLNSNEGFATSYMWNAVANTNQNTILKTTDGGVTWSSQFLPNTNNNSILSDEIYMVSSQVGFIALRNGQLFATFNGGTTWNEIQNIGITGWGYKPSIQFIDPNTGYICWGGKYFTNTTDGGQTWSNVSMIHSVNDEGAYSGIAAVSPNNVYVCGTLGIYKTTTLGQTNGVTPTLSATTYCPSSPISAPYTLQGTFNAGNIFTLELSDASGSFQNPVTLASATSTSAGTLSGTLPANLAQGTGYKVRITATNPVTVGAESSVFTVNSGFAAQITNVPANLTTASSTITMTGSPAGGTFTINGTAATQFNAATLGAGTHTVVYSVSQVGCAATVTQYVSVTAATVLTASTTATSVCAGSNINVNYNAQGNYDPSNYFTVELSDELGSFAAPTVISSFANTGTGTLTCALPQGLIQGNSYRVRVVASSPANTGTASSIFTVQASPMSSVAVNVNPSNVICGGDNVTFQATPTNGGTSPVYQWKLNGTNAGTNLYQYSNNALHDADLVWVEMTSNAVCASTTPVVSMLTNMSVTEIETPTIESLDNVMASSAFTGNQWLINGQPIQGATGQFYEATQTGFYQVQVTINGCTATSTSFPFTYIGIDKPIDMVEGIVVYPNPTQGNFTIEWDKPLTQPTKVEVLTTIGQVVYSQTVDIGQTILNIQTPQLTSGIYLVKVEDKQMKLVVE